MYGQQNVSLNDLYQTAIVLFQQGDIAGAQSLSVQLLAALPKNPDVLHLAGAIANQLQDYKQALKLLRQALKINDRNAFYHSTLGLTLQNSGDLSGASVSYRRAIMLDPNLVDAHMNLGNVLREQGDLAGSVQRLEQALALNPNEANVYYNLGLTLQKAGFHDEAGLAYEKAISINPALAQAYTNIGTLYKDQGRFEDALTALTKSLEINPLLPETYNNLGIVLNEMQHHEAAIEQFKKSLALRPDNDETLYNLGFAYRGQKNIALAIETYTQALHLNPENVNAACELLHQRQHACLWGEETEALARKIMRFVRQGREGVSPFIFLNLPATAADQLQCARTFGKKFTLPAEKHFPHDPARKHDKIRIGYLSADYHQHATAYLMAEMFERHNRDLFDIYAYSYGPDDDSFMRQRLVKTFDHFVEMRHMTHQQAAQRIYDDQIDILIDLKGYTGEGRLQIAAQRPAPVQVSYLGYPGTLGVDFMDYIIADPFITPMDQQPFYSEKIVQLPDTYQPNDTHREIHPDTPTRAACGLPDSGFVFCSFNNAYKITPAVFDIWMRLLKQVPESVLWLFEPNALVKNNLRREAQERGIDPDRLIFAPGLLLDKHLARHVHADLFLDALPINAHTTASDALWAGLPVLTCAGNTFAGRVAGSLLRAAGMEEMITSSWAEYEAKALQLAQNPAHLKTLRDKLQNEKMKTPLFDIERFTKNIESAYLQMWRRYQQGEKPSGFSV